MDVPPNNDDVSWRPGVAAIFFWIFMVVGSVPAVLLSVWTGDHHQEAAEVEQDQALRGLASTVQDTLSRYLEDRRRMVTLIKNRVEGEPSWTSADLSTRFDADLEAARTLVGLDVTGLDGRSIVAQQAESTGAPGKHLPVVHTDQDYFLEHKETRSVAWSRARSVDSSPPSAVVLAMGVRQQSTGREGVLVGAIGLSALAADVDARVHDDSTRVVMVDHTGQVVHDSHGRLDREPEAHHPFTAECPSIAQALADEQGALLRSACVSVPLGTHQWAVWVVKPQAALAEELADARWWQLGALLLVLVLVAGLAFGLGAGVRRYFVRLADLVRRMREGSLDLDLPRSHRFTPGELVAFRSATRQMLHQLRTSAEKRQALLDELEAANHRLKPLAEAWAQIGEAVEILDREGRILFANPACVEVLGDAAAAEGAVSTIWEGERGVRISAAFKRRQRWTGEVTVEGPQGRRVQAVTATPVFADDHLERVVVIRWDLTDLRTAELMAAHSERLANLGTLAAGLAHEINNPLTYIMMHLHVLREDVQDRGDTELTAAANEALEGVGLIQKVVKEILLIARGRDQSGLGEPRELVPVAQIVDSAATLARGRLRDRAHIEVTIEGDPHFSVRVTELAQVLVNLVVNAGLAYPEGGPTGVVEVRASVDHDAGRPIVVVEVRDSGVGMTDSELRQAFDPFFTTRKVGEGTGLGLPLARSIVDAHGGTLSAQSAKGMGSVFTVRLPAGEIHAHDQLPVLRLVPDQPLRILVVDDDHRVARVIERSLSSHHVTVAIGGMAALRCLEQDAFDVVLSDVMMPDLDGPALFEEVALHWPHLVERFAFVTGAPRGSAVTRALRETGRPVFHKPFQAHVIEAWLATVELV